ncbi:MAG: cyclic pyranopterin monophosphate synthase MoaC [Verrucomicrobiota bacterium]
MSETFSHLNAEGEATMVGVGHKPQLQRTAIASGALFCSGETLLQLKKQALPKGDALTVAKIAGIQAAKRTADWIPLCHTLPLSKVDIEFQIEEAHIAITATAETVAQTGVEMEALTAVSAAALTLYDMCKAVDKQMRIGDIVLEKKTKKPLDHRL